ncbi:sigma-54-dependent Fis family transcriptional regulator, partial [candidate division KSB1 bacterium]|nr:sigma-54-dependent Fis family transcriptional regulator [candidate division KSB1 bacterium]
ATHRDLKALVAQGKFREDLFYRLHIIPIYLPPLRERVQDIPLLSEHFLLRIGARIGRPNLTLTREAIDSLCVYHWPGNVRELENILERAAVLAEETNIDADDLPIHSGATGEAVPQERVLTLDQMLDRTEKQAIERAMQQANGVKTRAAAILGVKTSALYYKLQKYGLI